MLAILVPLVISDESPMITLVVRASVVKYTWLSTNANLVSKPKRKRTPVCCFNPKLSTEDNFVYHRDHGLYS